MTKEQKQAAARTAGSALQWLTSDGCQGPIRAAPYILMAGLSPMFWTGMDIDSYYMIPQGKSILADGFTKLNPYSFYPDAEITVQQWAYCIMEYLMSLIPWNAGLWLLMMLQAWALYALLEKMLMQKCGDGKDAMACAAGICAVYQLTTGYLYTLRPETLTLTLLLAQYMALEAYRDKGRLTALIAVPILTVLEANLHGAMWPMHLCIWAAYALPPLWPGQLRLLDGHISQTKTMLLAGTAATASAMLNPYGIDGALYIFRSMSVFRYIPIDEQAAPSMLEPCAIAAIATAAWLVWIERHKKCRSSTAYIAAGFIALAVMNRHGAMFLPVATAVLLADTLAERQPQKKNTNINIGAFAKPLWFAAISLTICLAWCICCTFPRIMDHGWAQPASDYITENRSSLDAAMIAPLDIAPVFLYDTSLKLLCDTRPELMLESMNHKYDIYKDYIWLENGHGQLEMEARYGGIGEYLDHYDIEFIADFEGSPGLPYLNGWLQTSEEWTKMSFEPDDNSPYSPYMMVSVWHRINDNNDNKGE